MAFFKTRKGGDEPVATPRPAESIEALRRRARHRLIGAGVLVLVGVVAFPVLFDTQPRPIAVDIPIEIPDRNKGRPLPAPPPVHPAATTSSAGSVSQPALQAATVPSAVPAPASASKPSAAAAATPTVVEARSKDAVTARPELQPGPKSESKVVVASETKADARSATKRATGEPVKPETARADATRTGDGAKAQALLDGKPVPASQPAVVGRFVVQVGSFTDAGKAHEARVRVERAGLKTYAQMAETRDGKRIRVRVGPFGTRAEADKAAGKIKGLDMPAAILSL